MVSVEPDILQVVVFASRPNAFLRIGGSCRQLRIGPRPLVDIGGLFAQKDGNELIHARIGEKEIGGTGHQARRRHDSVILRLEEIQKVLTDLLAGTHGNAIYLGICRCCPVGRVAEGDQTEFRYCLLPPQPRRTDRLRYEMHSRKSSRSFQTDPLFSKMLPSLVIVPHVVAVMGL